MMKIRVSYTDPEELRRVLGLLSPIVIRHKEVLGKEGQPKKSYIEADLDNRTAREPREDQKMKREKPAEKILKFPL